MKLRDNPTHWHMVDRQRVKLAKRDARAELPADWLPIIGAEAAQARPEWGGVVGHPLAQLEVWRGYLDEYGDAGASNLSDSEIKARAAGFALEARLLDLGELPGAWSEWGRIVEFCRHRGVEPPPVALLLQGCAARVRCPYWWRRALRRMIARKCERGAMALGLVSKPAGQPYASNAAVWRRLAQNERNAAAAQNIIFENDEGRVSTLADLVAASPANKAIRRGELMTRIRGCEEIAVECGHPGLFLTLTCPSRFHATLRDGERNPKHDGSAPTEGQAWLRRMWAKARAKLHRQGVRFYGFRVAEPHHDGCVHWHALLWFEGQAQAEQAGEVIRDYWLSDDGAEAGASKYRVNIKAMEPGGAAGYIAKYVAKNIDDHAIDSHADDYAEGPIGPDLLGDVEVKPSMRVEAWAATWGIRQFQALGQPPVGVWRELRRVREDEARRSGFGGPIWQAWCAVQRRGDVLASWYRYVRAQGGVMRGRACRIAVRTELIETEGLYGQALRRLPVGVALAGVKGSRCCWSNRRLWRPVEASEDVLARLVPAGVRAARSGAPRTRVNNCTADPDAAAVALDFLRGQGGTSTEETQPCDAFNAPTAPARWDPMTEPPPW